MIMPLLIQLNAETTLLSKLNTAFFSVERRYFWVEMATFFFIKMVLMPKIASKSLLTTQNFSN